MMKEIPEGQETGDLVAIYADLRQFCAVPYVSSLQRHVATMPGCLEYAWAICRPVFASGQLQRRAWGLAQTVGDRPFPPLTLASLTLMGVNSTDLNAIRNIYANFVRVAPLNLLFAGLVEALLKGAEPGNQLMTEPSWSPPLMLDTMPPMPPVESLDTSVQAIMMQLATRLGGQPFVPGMYRLLAPWPAYLAHAAALIEPLIRSAQGQSSRQVIADSIVDAAQDLLPHLAAPPAHLTAPSEAQSAAIIQAIHTYRVTSPEMIVIGTLLLDSLPAAAQAAS